MTVLALSAAWMRFVKFGLASNVAGIVLFALVGAWFLWEQRRIPPSSPASPVYLYGSMSVLAAYVISYSVLPPLGRGVLAMASLALGMLACYPLDRASERFGLLAVLPLTLPLDMALQFVLGYPLRRASAIVASLILAPYGAHVNGTVLQSRMGALDVDAPCSGVYGLWAFLILGSIAALILRRGPGRSVVMILTSGLAGWMYNVVRTCLMFLYQFHYGRMSEAMHTALGVLAFGLSAGIFVVFSSGYLERYLRALRTWRTT
jgi:exosortase/archaeosortase family protein